jgi:peptidoglycan/LPS O-acetylase OafA/YrhL
MTDALEYASPPTEVVRPFWQRLIVVPMYYLGWAIGWAVAGSYAVAISTRESLDDNASLVIGGLLAGVLGAMLAYLARRRRWPQYTMAVLGGAATALVSWSLYDMWRGPRSMFWGFFFVFGTILLSGAVAALIGGAAGIALARGKHLRHDSRQR